MNERILGVRDDLVFNGDSTPGGYTPHQIDIIQGNVEPETQEEWDYQQDHCNDILPTSGGSSGGGPDPEPFVPPTHAGITHEKMGLDD